MPLWKWTEQFIDERECAVEAETEEEARAKMEAGDWLYEQTKEFYSHLLLEDLSGPYDD